MIELDNTQLILDYLIFPDKDTYYYLQVLQRDGGTKPRQRYSTLITQDRQIDLEEIKYLCRLFTARAYISVIPRSLKKFTNELSMAVIERVATGSYVPSTLKLPSSVALSPKTIKSGSSLWMFDCDNEASTGLVLKWCKGAGVDVVLEVPSFQGCHIIVKPFNPKKCVLTSMIKKESNTMIFGCKS